MGVGRERWTRQRDKVKVAEELYEKKQNGVHACASRCMDERVSETRCVDARAHASEARAGGRARASEREKQGRCEGLVVV